MATIGPAVTKFTNAHRVQESLLAPAERKALLWVAARTPEWLNSDHYTILGFGSQLLAGVCYWLARWDRRALLLVILCLALNWLGDSLDGTLARVRNRQRPRYGFYVDHVIDTFGALFLMGGLALSGYMQPGVAAALLIAFLMFSIEVYLATYTLGSFRLSYWKMSPTEIRLLLAIGNVALFFRPMVLGGRFRLFDIGGTAAAVVMGLMLVVSSIRNTRALYRQERLS